MRNFQKIQLCRCHHVNVSIFLKILFFDATGFDYFGQASRQKGFSNFHKPLHEKTIPLKKNQTFRLKKIARKNHFQQNFLDGKGHSRSSKAGDKRWDKFVTRKSTKELKQILMNERGYTETQVYEVSEIPVRFLKCLFSGF